MRCCHVGLFGFSRDFLVKVVNHTIESAHPTQLTCSFEHRGSFCPYLRMTDIFIIILSALLEDLLLARWISWLAVEGRKGA